MYNAALPKNDFDEVGFYTGMFPAGCPYIYYHEEHPLMDRFRKLYGDTMFLMYHPSDDKEEFFVLLVYNLYAFDKYVSLFFNRAGSFNKEKIKAFGKVELLMAEKDEPRIHASYRNAINTIFKHGNPFDGQNAVSLTYLYSNGNMTEAQTLFKVSENFMSKKMVTAEGGNG